MDIRNFLGNNKPSSKNKITSNNSKSDITKNNDKELKGNIALKSKRIIHDDEDVDGLTNNETVSYSKLVEEVTCTDNEGSLPNNGITSDKLRDTNLNMENCDNNKVSIIPKEVEKILSWKSGEKVPYQALVNTFDRIESISSRLEKESLFCNLFRGIILTTPEDLETIVYLSSNKIFPAYEGLELGIGDALLIKAVVESTGRNKAAVQADYDREGDLGTVASQSRSSQSTLGFAVKPKPLTAVEVLEQLRLITRTTGEKSIDRKVGIIKKMLIRCQRIEAKYLIRALQGKLRIGTAEQTTLVSLAQSFALSSPFASPKELKSHPLLNDENLHDISDDEKGGEEMETGSVTVATVQKNVDEEDPVPEEAIKLQNMKKLTKEQRMELAVVAVKRAFSECPSYTLLVRALLTTPLHDLHKVCRLQPGVPVAPMLAKPTKKLEEVLKRLSGQMFTMEYKYDGERAQIHILEDGSTKIFSRNSEDNSLKYPDIVDVVKRARTGGVTTCVLDAEIVAYDREKACLLPFQILSTRKRKVDEGDEANQKVKIVLQAFDLIFLNGRSLLRHTLQQRRELLKQSFTEEEGFFYFARGQDCLEDGDTTPIEIFMQEACAAQCEGLMVKTLSQGATYEPSRRSTNWLKLKKDYIEGMGVCDSVDLVPLGGYKGRGKRVNTYGAYLMACYDPESDEYQSVCKVGTGFKDEDLSRLFEVMSAQVTPGHRKPSNYVVDSALEPDDWFEPKVVWELAAADLSKSSVHRGGIGRLEGSADRGIGLRFPRFLRERPDKSPENATTSEQIVELFLSQGHDNGDGGEDNDEDDLL